MFSKSPEARDIKKFYKNNEDVGMAQKLLKQECYTMKH